MPQHLRTYSSTMQPPIAESGPVTYKVNSKLVGKEQAGIMQHEPGDTLQIGADLVQPVGDYKTPNHFSGIIENLTFKYPNGT